MRRIPRVMTVALRVNAYEKRRSMPHNDLTFLVLHHRTPAVLASSLRTLQGSLQQLGAGSRIIVVDSSPEEETAALPTLERAELLRVANKSFAYMLNQGLAEVKTRYAAHLNADVFVNPRALAASLGALAEAPVAMSAPRAKTPAGRWQPQGLPYKRHDLRLALRRSDSLTVPWLSGCIQFVKMDAVTQVGGMDERYRFYNEDMAWCYAFNRAGWQCRLVNAEVIHLGGSSTPQDPRFVLEGYRGGYLLSQEFRSRGYQRAHRAAMIAYSALLKRIAKDEFQQNLAQKTLQMFTENRFDESPFGETLRDENPDFLR